MKDQQKSAYKIVNSDVLERILPKVLPRLKGVGKNDVIVSAMYEMYKQGKSTRDIARIYKKHHGTIGKHFQQRGYILRNIPPKDFKIVDGIFFREQNIRNSKYFRGIINGKRVMLQRYIWEKHNGAIKEGCVIHFKNLDYRDLRIENLVSISRAKLVKKYGNRK